MERSEADERVAGAVVAPRSIDDVVDRLRVALAALQDAVALLKGEDEV